LNGLLDIPTVYDQARFAVESDGQAGRAGKTEEVKKVRGVVD